MQKLTDSKLGKEYVTLYIVTHLFNLWRVHHVKCWDELFTAGIKTAGRNINNLRYADDTTLMAENKEELKSLLME